MRWVLHCRDRGRGVVGIALVATLSATPQIGAIATEGTASDIAVKAALLYNFAKFAQWPALSSGASILVCVVGDESIATALVDTVHGQNISGHGLEVCGR